MAFNLGDFTTGPSPTPVNPMGEMIKQVVGRIGQIQEQRIAARGVGLAEEEKLRGMARFYTSPEAEGYFGGIAKRTGAMLGGLSGLGPEGGSMASSGSAGGTGEPTQNPEGEGLAPYVPQYHRMTDISLDPATGMPRITLRQEETPESQKQGAVWADAAKMLKERQLKLNVARNQVQQIAEDLAKIPTVRERDYGWAGPFKGVVAPGVATAQGKFLGAMGTAAPQYAQVTATINAAIPDFIQSVSLIPGSRLNLNELKVMGTMMRDLPLLDDVGRMERFKRINALLETKAGVRVSLSPDGRLDLQDVGIPGGPPAGTTSSPETAGALPPGFTRR